MGPKLSLLLLAAATLFLSQNCTPTKLGYEVHDPQLPIITPIVRLENRMNTSGYDSVRYYPLDWTTGTFIPTDILIDLQSGGMTFTKMGLPTKSCLLEVDRLRNLANLLAESEVCIPVFDPRDATCLAQAIPDIELIGATTIRLAGQTCASGAWLCDGKDQVFRALLKQINDSPPVGCQ